MGRAESRGLPNIKSMVDAIPALNTEKAVALFEKFGVFTKAELDSRVEIEYETYAKEINIEAKAMIDIATKQIIPAVIQPAVQISACRQRSWWKYQTFLQTRRMRFQN